MTTLRAESAADFGSDETMKEQSGTRSVTLQPGRIVKQKLRLLRPLCQRETASLWAAEHLALRTEVAVKFITMKMTETLRRQFERDVARAAQIGGPHVVQVFDIGALEDGPTFVVSELLDGVDLGTHLARVGRLELSQTAV